jgi:hypothetical protein
MSDFELQRRVDLLERMVKDILRQLFIAKDNGSDGTLFPVTLAQAGGAAGDAGTAATFTYTVSDVVTEQVIGAGVSPNMQRPTGLTLPGTVGVAYYRNGSLYLLWCDETPDAGECE